MKSIVSDGIFSNIGLASRNTEKAIPVENAENEHYKIPKTGKKLGMTSEEL